MKPVDFDVIDAGAGNPQALPSTASVSLSSYPPTGSPSTSMLTPLARKQR